MSLLGALCCPFTDRCSVGFSEKFNETLENLLFEVYVGELVDGE